MYLTSILLSLPLSFSEIVKTLKKIASGVLNSEKRSPFCPMYLPLPGLWAPGESRESGGAALVSQASPLGKSITHGRHCWCWQCLSTLLFPRQILDVRVGCSWKRAGRVGRGSRGVRKRELELGRGGGHGG